MCDTISRRAVGTALRVAPMRAWSRSSSLSLSITKSATWWPEPISSLAMTFAVTSSQTSRTSYSRS